jgi:hypothetical protein
MPILKMKSKHYLSSSQVKNEETTRKLANKGITKSQARRNCDVISFQSDMGTDRSTYQRTNIVSYRGATSRLKTEIMKFFETSA